MKSFACSFYVSDLLRFMGSFGPAEFRFPLIKHTWTS